MIDFELNIARLMWQAQDIRQMALGISAEQARWKPDAGSWSILEVVNHLYDEEREDFRVRLKHILEQAEGMPPSIDPQGWVTARGYNQRELEASVQNFMQERAASLTWLRGLSAPDWNSAIEMPFGRMTAGDMFAAWVAHDLLHLRQLVELRYTYLKQDVEPYQIRYAGEW
jgi:hypothetical protein